MEMTVTILSYTHLLFVYNQVLFVSMYNFTYISTCICLVTTMFACYQDLRYESSF